MTFSFETPLILRLRRASRHPLPLIAAILFFLGGIGAALYGFLFDLSPVWFLLAADILIGLADGLPFLLARNDHRPLPGAGYGIAAGITLFLGLAFAARAVLLYTVISLVPVLFGFVLGGALCLGVTAAARFCLRDTARNNRPHAVIPTVAGMLICLIVGAAIGFTVYRITAAHITVGDIRSADYFLLSCFALNAIAAVLSGVSLILLGLSQKEKKQ